MLKEAFFAYSNETDIFKVEEIIFKNGLEQIVIEGKAIISKDSKGFKNVIRLKRIVDALFYELKHDKSLYIFQDEYN